MTQGSDTSPVESPAAVAADALVWPPPVADSDVVWFGDDEPPKARTAPAVDDAAASTAGPSSPASPTAAAATADPSIPLSSLVTSGVSMEWHHAVALVQQVLDQVTPDRSHVPAGSIPPIESIRLEPSSRLQVRLSAGDEPFIPSLGRMLAELLQANPAPAPLRLLALRATSESGGPTLEQFARELAGWERPGRAGSLGALYARAAAVTSVPPPPVPPVVEAAPQPATPPTRVEPVPPATADLPLRVILARHKRTVALVAAALCVFVSAATLAVYSIAHSAPSPAAQSASRPDTAGDPDPGVGSPTERPRADRVPPSAARAKKTERAVRVNPAGRKQRGAVARSAQGSATSLELFPAVAGSASIEGIRAPERSNAAALTPAIAAPQPEPLLFTSSDRGVVEPVLVRPYLPLRPHTDIPAGMLGVLELIVDEHGAVESVHLNSPANRYRERWWVFAAKQWQFQPAVKNGKSVRFLKRIPLTDLNVLEPQ